jgi:hypothetical protein
VKHRILIAALLVGALGAAGCSTKGATFEQGVFAGQAQGLIKANHADEAADAAYWQGVAYAHQRADIEETGATARAKAASLRSPQLAAEQGWNAAARYGRELMNLEQVHGEARANRSGRGEIAVELSNTPVDVFQMSERQNQARSEFVRSTVTGGIQLTTSMIADWQAAEARASALKEQEKRDEDLAKREKSLADKIAEMEAHHEAPAETQPTVPPAAPVNPTTPATGS